MPPPSNIRTAYLISVYPAFNHTFILREIRGLRARGFDIHVASISNSDRAVEMLTDEEQEEQRQTFYVKATGIWAAFVAHLAVLMTTPMNYVRGLWYAIKIARLDLPKIVAHLFYFTEALIVGRWMRLNHLTHLHTHFSSTVVLFVAKTFPVTISMTIHGSAEFENARGFYIKEKIAASKFVVAISNFGRSQLMRYSDGGEWSKIEVAPLGINPERFTLRAFEANPSPFEIICVGTLSGVKGFQVLIHAVKRLVDENRNVRLRIVGDGFERSTLEALVHDLKLQNQVVFEGWRNQNQLVELYKKTDVFALASFAEGVPVVLMEAMAMGIPCVASRITGIPELIRDEVDGLLVTPADDAEMAGKIARLMDDTELRARFVRSGRERVLEKYNLEINLAHLAAIFTRRLADTPNQVHAHIVKQAHTNEQHLL